MPSVDVAMSRSLQDGPWDRLRTSLARSVAEHLASRNIIEDAKDKVTDIKTALSSWDNCMAANFCKWPAIAIIVVGSLIILSIVFCIVRCCCLGKACCCGCFSCLKCCGNCCGACDTPGERKHKYLDEPYIPPHQGYRTEAPMQPFAPIVGPSSSGPPQYAEFDVSKKGGEDSLPQMPSWEGAGSKKVATEEEAVEMNNLSKPTNGVTDGPPSPGAGSSVMPVGAAMHNTGPQSPYGRPGHSPASPRMGGPGQPRDPRDPYANNYQTGYGNNQDTRSDGYGLDQPYDMPPAGTAPGMAGAMGAVPGGRNSPAPSYRTNGPNRMNAGYADMPSRPDEYGSRDPYNASPAPGPGYGMQRQNTGEAPYGSRGASPGPGAMGGYRGPHGTDPAMRGSPGPRQSPRPHGDPYGRPPRGSPAPPGGAPGYGRQPYSPTRDNFNSRTHSPAPDRQYAQSPRPRPPMESPLAQQHEPPSSPIVNNSGFDFNSGFSRPQTSDNTYDRRPSESRETPGNEGYPGYKPYRPAQEGWSGV